METIIAIEPYKGTNVDRWSTDEAGFQIKTDRQTITLAIDDESSCCESWGYFMSEDDLSKFIGEQLLGISITDTNRTGRKISSESDWDDPTAISYYDGDVMFVDIETSRGILQFVAKGYTVEEIRVGLVIEGGGNG